MNSPAQPDPYSPLDAEASVDSTKPKASKSSRLWALLVGLLLAAALVLFALDRLGVRLPTTPSSQTSMPSEPGGLSEASPGSAPTSASAVLPPATGSATNSATVMAPPAKPVAVYARQQDQIQALIGQVQGLLSLAQPPNLMAPTQPPRASVPPAAAPQAAQGPVTIASTPQSGSASPTQDPLAGPSLWSRLSDSLSELFVVRRLSPTAQPMLDEAGDRLARQELRLLLLSARMSLMMEQPRQARADLVAAQGLLPKFFRTEDASVQAFADQVTALLSSLPGQP